MQAQNTTSLPPLADTACQLQCCSGTCKADLGICSTQINMHTNEAEVMSRKRFVCAQACNAQTTYDIHAYTTGAAIQNTAGYETSLEVAAELLLQPNIKNCTAKVCTRLISIQINHESQTCMKQSCKLCNWISICLH